MTPTALRALHASILHWKRDNLAAKSFNDPKIFSQSCPLCKLYINATTEQCNIECPVKAKTGKNCCYSTPWRKVDVALGYWRNHELDAQPLKYTKACKEMIAFLKSLLPKKGKKPCPASRQSRKR